MDVAGIVQFVCVFVFTAIGAVSDLRTRKLPNVLTVPAFGAGLLFHAVNGFYAEPGGLWGAGGELWFALQGFAFGFSVLLVLWFIGGAAGGDVKLMGALGCWLGTWLTFQVLVLSAVLAGLLTLAGTTRRVFQLKRMNRGQPDARAQRAKKKKEAAGWTYPLRTREGWQVPFGVPAAVAAWCLLAMELAGKGLQWSVIIQ